jgi:putative tryptophan/tyrosine transport system substrate-binding protein
MRRRAFIAALGGAAAWPLAASAQQGERKKRIVVLSAFAESDTDGQAQLRVFRDGLSKLGWIEGQNVNIETLWRAGNSERASALVSGSSRTRPILSLLPPCRSFWLCGAMQARSRWSSPIFPILSLWGS